MSDRVFFIGGPGTLSAHTIPALLERQYHVAVYSHPSRFSERDPRVQTYSGERSDTLSLQAALQDFRPDVVLDFICFTPQEAAQILPLVAGKVRQFVFVSTVDVYGYPLSRLPFREDDPWHPETQSPYAADKRLCEALFKARFSPSGFPLTIVRPAYSFGSRFILSFTLRDYGIHMLRRLRDGRPILVPGDGTTLMHASSAQNTGRMIAAVVDAPQAIGKDYTCGHPTFTTHNGYLDLFARALGVQPNRVYIPTGVILSHPDPFTRTCLLPALTRHNVAFSIDRFQRDFPEFAWTGTLENWAKHVVDWNIAQGRLDAPDEIIFDDRLIAAWQEHLPALLGDRS